jgi:hypothetical protein
MWRFRTAHVLCSIRRSSWVTVVGFFWLCLGASPSAAAGRDARERAALTACLAGDYGKGVTILSQLFVETNDANYIYNQGRCFEQNARYPEAIARFQEYLTVGRRLRAADKAEAHKHIAACEVMLAKQSRSDTAAASPERATSLSTVSAAAAAPVVAPKAAPSPEFQRTAVASPQPARPPGGALRTTGVVLAGVGGAALVAGIILNLKVNGMADDFRRLDGYSDAKESDRKTYETLGWVSYGVGAACVVSGVVLYVLGHRAGDQDVAPPVIAPTVSTAGVAATLNGRF